MPILSRAGVSDKTGEIQFAPCLRTTADAKVDVDPGLLSFSEIMKRIVLMIGLKERESL